MMTKHRVLVVDDYPDAAEVACNWFSLQGHDCRAASCGKAALDQAKMFAPDIVIVDIGLPDLSGYDVARALRKQAGDALYLTAITGWVQPETATRAFDAGFDHYILKPANANKLRLMLWLAEVRKTSRSTGTVVSP